MIVDKGWLKIQKEFDKLNGAGAKVGFLADSGNEDEGTSIVFVAAINNFGSDDKKNPKREFMESGIREYKDKINDVKKRALKAIGEGRADADKALQLLGFVGKAAIQDRITKISSPANAQETVDKKGFNNPLVASGQMRAATDYEVYK